MLAAAWAHGAAVGWGTWGDVSTDTGRDLELARLLAEGRRLYVDVAWYYGPLAPHLNALLVRIFGAHVHVFVGAGLAVAALAAAAIAAIVRPLAGALAAAVAGVAFLYCCAFAHLHYANVFNWVLPYLSASTYGMLFALWSVERLLRHVRTGRPADLAASTLLLAAAALTKTEPAVAALAAHGAVLAARALDGAMPRTGTLAAYGAAVLLVVAGYGLALWSDPIGLARANFVDVVTHPSLQGFLTLHAGLADPGASLWAMTKSALALGAALLVARGIGAIADGGRATPPVAGALGAAAVAGLYGALEPTVTFAALPLLGLVAVGVIVAEMASVPAARTERLPELALWSAALACLARMPLASGAPHYGFYLLPFAIAAFVVWWFRTAPAWVRVGPRGARAHAALAAALVLAVAGRHFYESRTLFAAHDVRAEGPRGRMWLLGRVGDFPLGRAYADTIGHLATYPATTRVMAVPSGAAMPFLAGLASAGDRTAFLPAEMGPAAEDHLLATLAREPPDLVVSIRLDLREWGSRGFGVDYARRTWSWVRAHYEPVAAFGPEELVLVLRRRD